MPVQVAQIAIPTDTDDEVRLLVVAVLTEALCDPLHGLAFPAKSLSGSLCWDSNPPASNNPVILHFALSIQRLDDVPVRLLVLAMLAACPDIAPGYFAKAPLSL